MDSHIIHVHVANKHKNTHNLCLPVILLEAGPCQVQPLVIPIRYLIWRPKSPKATPNNSRTTTKQINEQPY